jgi:hypothetical protein
MSDEISDEKIIEVLGHYSVLPLRDESPEEVIEARYKMFVLAIREIIAIREGRPF